MNSHDNLERYPFYPFDLISSDSVDRYPFKVAFKSFDENQTLTNLFRKLEDYFPLEKRNCRICDGFIVVGVEENEFDTSLLGTSDDTFEICRFDGITRKEHIPLFELFKKRV